MSIELPSSPQQKQASMQVGVAAGAAARDLPSQWGGATRPASIHRLDLFRLAAVVAPEEAPPSPGEQYEAQVLVSGRAFLRTSETTIELEPGQILLSTGAAPELHYSADSELWSVLVPESILREACSECGWLQAGECVRFNRSPCSRDELDHLVTLLGLVSSESASAVVRAQLFVHYAHAVANKLLFALQRNQPTSQTCGQARLFERLERHIEARIKQDISVEQLAQFAGLSQRSLYQVFKDQARTSPRSYIRRKKLEHVYATLMDPAVRVASVTAVALDYGFTHLGRFAELYKSSFGILPSESLKARPPGK